MPKPLLLTIALLCAILSSPDAEARRSHGRFGLGLMVGTPTGLSGKLHLEGSTALAMGIGEAYDHGFHDDGIHVHVDFLWHPAVLARTADFLLPLHIGVGGRLLDGEDWHDSHDHHHGHTHLGVRMPLGLSLDFRKVPLDVFFELALVADVLTIEHDDFEDDHDLLDLTLALGIRYYF